MSKPSHIKRSSEPSQRQLRVGELVRHKLAEMLARGDIHDDVLASGLITIPEVRMSPDLKLATAYIMPLGGGDPAPILAALDRLAGGRALGVPYTWGTIGIAYNAAKITERLGDMPVDSWDMLFDPEIAGKLADCGIAVLDSPVEMVSVTLNYLGLDPYSTDPEALDRARDTLATAARSVRYFHNQRAAADLPSGDVCMAVMYSGDAGIAQAAAWEADNGVDILYAIPKEGTLMWIDLMSIPVDSDNIDEAYRFIDYMLRPEVMAGVSNTVFFANANAAADAFVDPEILSDPGIYPDADTRARLFPDLSMDLKALRARTRLWTNVKSGQ